MKTERLKICALLCLVGTGMYLPLPNTARAVEPLEQETSSDNYKIGVGDVISVTVLNHPEFSLNAQILPDGTFVFPILGKLKAIGRTREELSSEIAAGLKNKKQLVKPYVTVNVVQTEIKEVTVLGTVRAVGKFVLKENWTILDALSAAGGVGAAASATDRWEFYRAELFRDKETQAISLDLKKVYSNDPAQNIRLKNGDKIYVSVKPRNEISVTVIGEVTNGHGGVTELPKDHSILTVLNDLGGVSEAAALSKATILRNGTVMKIDLRGYKKGKIEKDIELEGGDVLTIPRIEDRYKVNGAVTRPGEPFYLEDRKLTLFDVLTQAGIPSTGADLKKVGVTRTEKGVTTTQKYDIDKMLKGDRSQDIDILPNDEIYVPFTDPNKRKPGLQEYLTMLTVLPSLYLLLRGIK
jgi:polysaccharide biosynthesis/export protein